MSDCVAIVQDLPFRQMILETAMHVSRSVTSDQATYREFMTHFDNATLVGEGAEELSSEKKQEIVRDLVTRVTEGQGCLGGAKETDAEPTHFLLQHILADNFEVSSTEYATMVKTVVQAIKVGASSAASAGRTSRVEAASRILNYIYNYLPSNSPLRPTTLLALLSVLALASDLEALTLTPASLAPSLNQWSISTSEKIAFLTEASEIYKSASLLSKALDLCVLALNIEVSEEVVEKAVVLALANETKFDLSEVLKTQGAGAKAGKAAELVKLFTEADELEAVSQGQTWAESNASYISGFDIPHFTPEFIVRKLRLIALTTLCSRSTAKQISYSEVASALSIPESEVEAWVIDAIRANLLKARLSQPASLIKIQSVSSAGTRRFGSEEWQTLERRLQDWKKQVSEARSVIADAEALAAQGPITHQRREGNGNRERGQQRREEEVTA